MPDLLVEKRDRVAYLTLNRPERLNTLTAALFDALIAAWRGAQDDPDVWAIVLTGAGDRGFCAGLELREYRERDLPSRLLELWRISGHGELDPRLHRWKPVVVAINGAARAGGVSLALFGDLRIASERATFGYPEVLNGIPPGVAGILLPRAIGVPAATRLLLLGEAVDAQEALRLGLVHEVVAHERLLERATELAQKLVRAAPLAVWATKQQIVRGLEVPITEGLRLARALADEVHRTEDFEEGRRAFLEKRPPHYQGR